MQAIKVILTKPKLNESESIQADTLAKAIEQISGVSWVNLPLFELSAKPEVVSQLHAHLSQTAENGLGIVVFVSPSALELSLRGLLNWPSGWLCAVMGRQSAELAKKLGVPESSIISPVSGRIVYSEDSDGLRKKLQDEYLATKPQILLCKGPRGRVEFPEQLRLLGFPLTVLETYDRSPRIIPADELSQAISPAADAVWVTSSEAATVLNDVIQGHSLLTASFKQHTHVLTTHERITQRCRELGFEKVVQIDTGVQSLLNWLNNYKNNLMKTDETATPTDSSSVAAGNPKVTNTSAVSPAANNSGGARPALIISIVSLVCVIALAFMGKDELAKSNQVLAERIQADKTRLTVSEESLARAQAQYAELKARFDMLQANQTEASNQRRALEEVYEKLIASRTAVSISEIEQLTSIAQRQLFVLGNVKGATVALEQAVVLLQATDEPRLIGLRAALEVDLAALRDVPEVKVIDLAIKLDLAIDAINSLPALAGAETTTDMTLAEFSHGGPGKGRIDPVQYKPNFFQATTGFVRDFFITAWEDIKGLVEITKVDNPDVLLLSAREITDVRNATRLSLLNARLSLLSRQADLLNADLKRSKGYITTYFDQKNSQVSRTLELLAEVEKAQLTIELPNLSRSLAALKLAKAGEEVPQ